MAKSSSQKPAMPMFGGSGFNKWILIAIPLVLLVIIMAWFVGTYNALISADQNVKQQWAEVQVNYQRRFDLIPNLVNVLKGYTQYERGLLESVTALRSQWMSAQQSGDIGQQMSAANQLESALKTIFAVREAYPEIKANTQFTALSDELAGTENRVAVSRIKYNEAVADYNRLVKFIPSSIVAGFMGYSEMGMFEAVSGAETAPVVNLS